MSCGCPAPCWTRWHSFPAVLPSCQSGARLSVALPTPPASPRARVTPCLLLSVRRSFLFTLRPYTSQMLKVNSQGLVLLSLPPAACPDAAVAQISVLLIGAGLPGMVIQPCMVTVGACRAHVSRCDALALPSALPSADPRNSRLLAGCNAHIEAPDPKCASLWRGAEPPPYRLFVVSAFFSSHQAVLPVQVSCWRQKVRSILGEAYRLVPRGLGTGRKAVTAVLLQSSADPQSFARASLAAAGCGADTHHN